MIEDAIKDIRAAEDKAAEIIRTANVQAKDMVVKAEAEAEKQRKETVDEVKSDTRSSVAKAEKNAEQKREATLGVGEIAAEKLFEEKEKSIDAAADEVVRLLVEKY